ncbi:MAG: TetR/AcrR family transcriptional regulator [Bifidobacteriaceae bacterium]|nr:TetR/AcrR family transcriptional regulator [Bifidobacteriaceae bacterium]
MANGDSLKDQKRRLTGGSLKERRRARIIVAAAELLDEREGAGFTVEEVATRAEVSRRTVFNYFASIDDLVVAVGADMLGGLVDNLRLELPAGASGSPAEVLPDAVAAVLAPSRTSGLAAAPASAADPEQTTNGDSSHYWNADLPESDDIALRAAVFADIAGALESVDLVAPMIRLTRALGGVGPSDQRVAATVQEAMARITVQLSGELRRRHPQAARLSVDLLVAALLGGVIVLYGHWVERSGLTDTAESRRTWSDLLAALIEQVGAGYLTAAPVFQPDRPPESESR